MTFAEGVWLSWDWNVREWESDRGRVKVIKTERGF